MVKSKLPPRSGSSLEAVEPHPQKGAIKFLKVLKKIMSTGDDRIIAHSSNDFSKAA